VGPIDGVIALMRQDLAGFTSQLIADQMSIAAWQRECGLVLRRYTLASYMAGADGTLPTKAMERELGRELNRQLGYLRRFAEEIRAGKQSDAQIAMRIGMYADRMRGVANDAESKAYGVDLPFVPGDGSTQCRTSCACSIDYQEEDGETVAYWKLGVAEHCPDCFALADLPHTEWQAALDASNANA
jgi:hypothetical protein